MICRISARDGLVMGGGYDFVAAHDDGTDRNFVFGRGKTRLLERRFHPCITTHDAPRTTHGCYARTGSRFAPSAGIRSNASELPSFDRSTTILSPSLYFPSRTWSASGFWSSR